MNATDTISLIGHGESIVPGNASFAWFFRCLDVLGYTTSIQPCFDETSKPRLLIIGDPKNARFAAQEIAAIREYVQTGGTALVLGRYGGDPNQFTNLSDLFPGLTWENTLVTSNGQTTYSLKVNAPPAFQWLGWATVDCPCSLTHDPGQCDWHPVLIVENNVQCLSEPSYDKALRKYSGNILQEVARTICAAAEYGNGRIACVGSRWMFSNHYIGSNTSFLRNILAWLRGDTTAPAPNTLNLIACRPDARETLRALINNNEHLFCFLAITGTYQAVLPDKVIDTMDLGTPWCEPVWVQDSFDKCISRLRNYPRVRLNNMETAEAIISQNSAAELVHRIRSFPIGIQSTEIPRIKGLLEAFTRFEAAILDCVFK